jgi:curved DNA-binding protein CbpA
MSESGPSHQRQAGLYEVLQVSPRACPDVIQAAYHALARAYHPDLNHAASAQRLMRQLNAAYDVLRSPERRARYDADCARSARVVGVKRTVRPRRASRAGVPGPTSRVDPRGGSPAMHVSVVMGFVALVLALTVAFWIISDALDDGPSQTIRPRAHLPERTADDTRQVPTDRLMAGSAAGARKLTVGADAIERLPLTIGEAHS